MNLSQISTFVVEEISTHVIQTIITGCVIMLCHYARHISLNQTIILQMFKQQEQAHPKANQ